MSLSPRAKINPAWMNLPRRKCDNCGASYKPTRPLRSIDKYGFCTPDCKKSFHRNGGAYRKLKGEMDKLIDRRLRKLVREELVSLLPRVRLLSGDNPPHAYGFGLTLKD